MTKKVGAGGRFEIFLDSGAFIISEGYVHTKVSLNAPFSIFVTLGKVAVSTLQSKVICQSPRDCLSSDPSFLPAMPQETSL